MRGSLSIALALSAMTGSVCAQQADRATADAALGQILGATAPAVAAPAVPEAQDLRGQMLGQMFEQVRSLRLLDTETLRALAARLEEEPGAAGELEIAELAALVASAHAVSPQTDYLRSVSQEAQGPEDRLASVRARLDAFVRAASPNHDDPYVSAIAAEGSRTRALPAPRGTATRAATSAAPASTPAIVPANTRRAAAAEPAEPPRPETILVVPGDTLGRIARAYYGSEGAYRRIAKANGLRNPNRIFVGQRLILP